MLALVCVCVCVRVCLKEKQKAREKDKENCPIFSSYEQNMNKKNSMNWTLLLFFAQGFGTLQKKKHRSLSLSHQIRFHLGFQDIFC